MPLRFLIPALLRVTATPCSTTAIAQSQAESQSQSTPPLEPSRAAPHPLHALLRPLLLTSRAASQKYHARITHILAEEGEPADSEEEYMWYAYHKDKVGDDTQGEDDDDEAQERLKNAWLEKFERRE